MLAIADPPPGRILIASDLHLGPGWDPETQTCVATENFLGDRAFAAWLTHYGDRAPDTLLILNGDVFDVLRVTTLPEGPDLDDWAERLRANGHPMPVAELRDSITRSEERYGLKTHDYKTVWKLLGIERGHPVFFEALAGWVAAGGRVLFITGNHDVEMYWPMVQDHVRFQLAGGRTAPTETAARIDFASGVVFDNLYVEHGNQYEPMTRVDGPPTLERPHDREMNLPLGSFVNRYFINRVEALDPFIDNVKPVQRSLLRLARQRPIKMLSTYFGAWRFLHRALQQRKVNGAVLSIALALALPVVAPLALLLIPGLRDVLLGWLNVSAAGRTVVGIVLGVLLSGVLPYVLGALGELRRRWRPPADTHIKAAQAAVTRHLAGCSRERAYVCMGHTHVSAVRRIPSAVSRKDFYINTGTWIALWPDDRPDLLGRTVYTYAQFDATDDGYVAKALEWDARAVRPVPATILIPARDR